MNGERAYLRDQLFRTLRNEYQVVERGWRFFAGLRFALISVTATFQFGLFGGYAYVFTRVEDNKLGYLGNAALVAIPIFGVVATYAIAILELRAQSFYLISLLRGRRIEDRLGITDGYFLQIASEPRSPPYLHPIRVVYVLLVLAWATLFERGIFSYFA